ncbi:MAG: hypothetical protein LBC76_12160 [Treponema sp.]|nr:hypothetical protein [Treponema sp.]
MNIKRFAPFLLTLCLFCTGFSVYAQTTAQEMEKILAKDQLTYAEAVRFVLQASEKLITFDAEEAFWFAAEKYWLPKSAAPDKPARIEGIALLIMHSFEFDGGFLYYVTKSPHYAFRELQYRNVIQGRADRYMKISGEYLIFTVGRALAERERQDEIDAKYAEDRKTVIAQREFLQPESYDFGLLLTQDTAVFHDSNFDEDNNDFIYKANAVPRFSLLIGDTASFITSMGFGIEYGSKNAELFKFFELLRTEFSIRFFQFGLRVGRFSYSDPMKFVADGLFDGIQLNYNSGIGRFGLGGWYTGIIYKKNANILMNSNDWVIYNTPMLKDHYFQNYFAPKRMFVSMDWDHPSIGSLMQINTALTAQFDMSNLDERYNSQYFTLGTGMNFKNFLVTMGGSIGLAEIMNGEAVSAYNFGVAGEFGFYFPLPGRYSSNISVKGRYGSGAGKVFDAYIPLTTTYYGEIFQVGIAGHTMLDLTYSIRFLKSLGASLTASYFIRNDLTTPADYLIIGADKGKKLLGMEIFSKLVWSTLSDIQLNFGIGAFLPPFGNNWPTSEAIWKFDLTTVLALY